MAEDTKTNGKAPRPAGQKKQQGYLVVKDQGGSFGFSLDPDWAAERARIVGGLVVGVPVVADHRKGQRDG